MATEIIEQNQLFRNVQKAKWAVEYNPFHKIFFFHSIFTACTGSSKAYPDFAQTPSLSLVVTAREGM